jgi:rubrerythrin
MAVRLLPLTVSELCAHALNFERDAAERCKDYAARLRSIGDVGSAEVFEQLLAEENEEIQALQAASGERKPAELSHWEYIWRLAYMPEALDDKPRIVPMDAREALQLTVVAKRRAESFYTDVADNAQAAVVRSCAQEMAANERRQLQMLEHYLADSLHGRGDSSTSRAPDGTLTS